MPDKQTAPPPPPPSIYLLNSGDTEKSIIHIAQKGLSSQANHI